jgi:malonate-semialdehyde dehydrogenase (acetylating) / methylmalonate-semialdehyde dehydrogenase
MALLESPLQGVLNLENYVDGFWEPSSGETLPVVNPATMQTIAHVPLSTADELDQAVQAAKRAFDDWRRTPPLARARCLLRLRDLMEANFEELSRIQTIEHGKTIDESRGETRRGIEMVEVAAGIPSLMMGRNLEDIASGIDEFLIRQPLGVFGLIGPYNFPFMVPLWFAPFAVATGNTIVVKPSSEDPISQVKITELVEEAGFPDGVWNVVHGGREVVGAMLDHPDIKGICFVGSTPVAKNVIYPRCGATGKRVIAQGGAKNFALVMPDADLPRTIAACMTSFYGNAGQRCLANANLVIVGEGLSQSEHVAFKQEVTEAFCAATRNITIGNGLDEAVQMGPLRDPAKKQRVIAHIEGALAEGAQLLVDGRTFELLGDWPRDAFLGPTVLDGVTPEMKIAQEEVFGPVAALMTTASLDEAIALIHANPFGNAASIFTGNGGWARKFRYEVQCGNIGINVGIAAPMAFFPFSGMKDSFFGDLHGQGEDVIRFFTESKIVIERWF